MIFATFQHDKKATFIFEFVKSELTAYPISALLTKIFERHLRDFEAGKESTCTRFSTGKLHKRKTYAGKFLVNYQKSLLLLLIILVNIRLILAIHENLVELLRVKLIVCGGFQRRFFMFFN